MSYDAALEIVVNAARGWAQDLSDNPDKTPQEEEEEQEVWEAVEVIWQRHHMGWRY